MLPKVLKNFNAIIEGRSFAGVAEEITLPALERKTEEYRAGGMAGPVELDLGLAGLSLDFTLGEYNEDVLRAWGVFGAGAIPLRFLGAARADGEGASMDAIEITVRGRWKKVEFGSVKATDHAKLKVEMPLTFFRYSVNGRVIVEIDLISGTEIVDGEDRQDGVRRALGLVS